AVCALPPPGQRIALASDAAFTFEYAHVLAGCREAGAELATFSPLADEPPPQSCDVCCLRGGSLALHAAPLSTAQHFPPRLARCARCRPQHAESGLSLVLVGRLAATYVSDPDRACRL